MDDDPLNHDGVVPVPTEPVVAGCVPAWIAAMVAATTDVLYLVVIVKQGPPYIVALVAGVFLLIAACAVAAALAGSTSRSLRTRIRCATGATFGLFLMGFLGLLSIGLPLLVAAGCAAAALVKLKAAAKAPVPGPG